MANMRFLTAFRQALVGSRTVKLQSPLDRLILWLVLLFLYLPITILIIFSFNDSRRTVLWKSFTLRHYADTFTDIDLLSALGNSITVALSSTVFSLLLGFGTAYALWRFRFPGKQALSAGIGLPLILPDICLGVGFLVFFARIGWPNDLSWPLSLGKVVFAHATFTFPFVAIILRARLNQLNPELMEAARDLGARERLVFRDVIIPHLHPSLIAAALISLTLSLDDFVVTFFASGPDSVTLPMKIYSMVRFSVTPRVNAASTLLVLISLALVALYVFCSRKTHQNL